MFRTLFTLGENPLFRPKAELPRFTLLATFPPESHPIAGVTILKAHKSLEGMGNGGKRNH
jgi:hypothetical protein